MQLRKFGILLVQVGIAEEEFSLLLVSFFGFQFEIGRDLQFLLALLSTTSFEQRLRQPVMRRCHLVIIVTQVGIERDSFLKRFNRKIVPLCCLISLTQMEVRIGVLRLGPRSLLQKARRQIPFSFDAVNNSEIVIGEKLVRVLSQLNLEFFGCLVYFGHSILQQICESQIVVSPRKVWIKYDGPSELFNCRGQEICFPIGATENDVKLRVIADLLKHAVVKSLCGSELMLFQISQSERVRYIVIIRC